MKKLYNLKDFTTYEEFRAKIGHLSDEQLELLLSAIQDEYQARPWLMDEIEEAENWEEPCDRFDEVGYDPYTGGYDMDL